MIKRDTAVEDYRRSGAEMLADFHRTRFVADRMETMGLERHFMLDIDGGRRFQGFIDRLARDAAGVVHIIDYKTGGRPPVRFGGKDGDQLEAYAVAMFAETDADELVLMLEYLRNGSTQTRRIRRAETDRDRATPRSPHPRGRRGQRVSRHPGNALRLVRVQRPLRGLRAALALSAAGGRGRRGSLRKEVVRTLSRRRPDSISTAAGSQYDITVWMRPSSSTSKTVMPLKSVLSSVATVALRGPARRRSGSRVEHLVD